MTDAPVQVWRTVDNGVALVMYGEDGITTLSMSVPCARDLARRINERCDQVVAERWGVKCALTIEDDEEAVE